MLRKLRAWGLQLLVLAAVLWGVHLWQTRHIVSGVAPEVTLQRSHSPDASTSLSAWRQQYAGQPVILYFWATWCTICRIEQPLVKGLVHNYPVLPIAMQSGSAQAVQSYEARHGLAWNSALDPNSTIAQTYGIQAVPSFVVLDAHGRVHSTSVGITSSWGLQLRLWLARVFA